MLDTIETTHTRLRRSVSSLVRDLDKIDSVLGTVIEDGRESLNGRAFIDCKTYVDTRSDFGTMHEAYDYLFDAGIVSRLVASRRSYWLWTIYDAT